MDFIRLNVRLVTVVNSETQGYLYAVLTPNLLHVKHVYSRKSVIDAHLECPRLCWCRIQVLYINTYIYKLIE